MALGDVTGDDGGIDTLCHLISRAGVKITDANDREAAILEIFVKDGACFGFCLSFESKILFERQGIDGNQHIAPAEIGGDLAGHQLGVGSGDIDVHIGTLQQAVHNFLPAFDFLQFIEEQVTAAFSFNGLGQLTVHVLGSEVLVNVHFTVFAKDDVFLCNAAALKLGDHHF